MTTWDDNEHPQGYLITFRTYGTWQHGDERGSVDRYHNKYRGPRVSPNRVMKAQHDARLKSEPVSLTARQRKLVEAAIREVIRHRNWRLLAINVRTSWSLLGKRIRQEHFAISKRILRRRFGPRARGLSIMVHGEIEGAAGTYGRRRM